MIQRIGKRKIPIRERNNTRAERRNYEQLEGMILVINGESSNVRTETTNKQLENR